MGGRRQLQPLLEHLPQPMCFRVADLEAGSEYPAHRHDWGQFVYSFSGVLEIGLAGRHYLAPPQYGIWIPPHIEHVASNRYEASYCSLQLEATLCERLPREGCTLAINPLIRAILEMLRQRRLDYPRSEEERRLFLVLLDQLAVSPSHDSYLPTSGDPQLGKVLHGMQQQPGDMRSLAEWAHSVHSTERTLSRRCHRDLGMSFSEWRQRLKVVQAIALLEAGRTVQAIALELGYSNASAFIAMFQRLMGLTPEEYRRRQAR
ncbi:MAG: helix-turn-helix transcriptional regulator [Pseudogulbenkiania sp.]|nr:helix-turn-helix transcriptional regulator [Pseudogulbenkiania sp.]